LGPSLAVAAETCIEEVAAALVKLAAALALVEAAAAVGLIKEAWGLRWRLIERVGGKWR
jgi:hypothetical protein